MKIKLPTLKRLLAATGVLMAMSGNVLTGQVTLTKTFGVYYAPQTFTVPPTVVTITIDASGSRGSDYIQYTGSGVYNAGGNGGRVQTVLTVTPGEVLQINVGSVSFNGGGYNQYAYGTPGGGATDIRQGGTALANRIMVAGGGGGAGYNGCGENGGDGGGTTGASGAGCETVPTGGTQSAGGAGGSTPSFPSGLPGTLGVGGDPPSATGGGGGGGGYYGGGGGCWQGGGGGSSYSNGFNTVHTQGYNTGYGSLSISYDAPGAALNFDGSSNNYINLGTTLTNSFVNESKITLEAWVMPTTTVGLGVIVGNYRTSGLSMQFLLRRDFGAYSMWVDCGAGFQNVTGGTVTPNTWQHVAGVWDGSALKLYVDGLAVATTTGVIGTSLPNSSNPVWIGGNTINESFRGSIDEVRIWKRALCVTEIQTAMSGELNLFQSMPAAYYQFNQGVAASPNASVTTLIDASSNNITGTLVNFGLTGTTSNWTYPGAVTSYSMGAFYYGPYISASGGAICSGKSFTIATFGANTYTYSSGSPIVSPTTNTVIYVTGTDALGCVSSNTAVSSIVVRPLPTVSVTSGTICSGKSFTITASGANTYTYSGGSIVAPTTNTSYNVTGTSSLGCVSSNTAVSSVVVNTVPVISVNNGTICNGQSFTITPSGADTYTYSGGSAIIAPATNTSYNVTGTSLQGCVGSNTAMSSVVVNTVPVISVNSATICPGNTTVLVPTGASTYTITGGNYTVTPLTTTSYSVTGTNTEGCISNPAIASVSVNATPTLTVNSGSICSNNSFIIVPSGANNYTVTGGNYTVSPLTTTSYSVTGTDINGCISASAAVSNVTVFATPTLAVNSATICSGNSVAIVPTGANTYTITGGNYTVTPLATTAYSITGTSTAGCISSSTVVSTVTVFATPTLAVNSATVCSGNSVAIVASGANTYTITGNNFTVTPLTSTSYSVTGTSTAGCISASAAVSQVSVNTTPTLAVNSGSICSNESFTVIPSGANTYTISGNNFTVTPLTTTSYSVTGTGTNGCVSAAMAVSNVSVSITPTVAVNNPTICSGSSVTIVPTGANTYTITGNNFIVTPLTTTGYSITGTSSAGCISSNTIVSTVSVFATPTLTVNNPTVCPGNSVAILPTGANTYTITGGNFTVTPFTTTSYSVTGTSAAGCTATNAVVALVSVDITPTVSVNSAVICKGASVVLLPTGADTYTISGGSFTLTPLTTTSYSVTGTSTAGCVSAEAVAEVTVNALPTIAISGSTIVCALSTNSLSASGAVTYTWSEGQVDATITVTPSVNTSYTVTGTDANGCINTADVLLVADPCTGISKNNSSLIFGVYPNPNHGEFVVETVPNADVIVLNSLGQLVHSEKTALAKTIISIDHLANGIYFIKVTVNDNQQVVKLIKE